MRYSERMNSFSGSMIRELFNLLQDPEIISFAGGEPAPDLYPLEEFKIASIAAFEEYGKSAISYDTTEGFLPLKEIIVNERLKAVGITDVSPDNVIVTNGSQQGIDFSGRIFLDKGDVVICESPTYLAALNVFNSYLANIIQVEVDDNGMKIDELEDVLRNNPKTKFIYTIPDFQNPTGITMSKDRRQKMVELAEKYDVIIVEDNPYVDLRIEGERIPAIKSFDKNGRVIFLGSFSKITMPGARLGYICADKDIISQYLKVKQVSDLQANSITQRQLAKYFQMNDVDVHLKKINEFYKNRRDAMIDSIKTELGDSVKFTYPLGGLFVWVTLPKHIDSMEVFKKAAKEEKVAFIPGAPFFNKRGNDNFMRLSYSKVPEELIREGIKRLGRVIKSFE